MPAHKTPHGYELRVTERCLTEDLAFREDHLDVDIDELARLDTLGAGLLRTFLDKRSKLPEPDDEDELERLATGTPRMYPLRRADQQRAVTWYDRQNGVVWLVAGDSSHKSGAPTDSYAKFRRLTRAQLLPAREDMTRLRIERADAEADAIYDDVPRLMALASTQRNVEVNGRVGRVPIAMVMTDDIPPHLYLAISREWERVGMKPPEGWLLALLVKCFRHEYHDAGHLPVDHTFPTREPRNEDIYSDFVTDWPPLD